MFRKAKVMGVAVVAVLALSAVAASAAQAAEGFNWSSGTTDLIVKQDATGGEQVFTTKWGAVKCKEVSGTATVSGTGALAITFSPVYRESPTEPKCSAPLGTKGTIEFHACMFDLNAGPTVGGKTSEIEGTADITCNGALESENHITINAPGCVITVGPQKNLGPIFYRNIGANEVTIEPKVKNIKSEASGFLCSGIDEAGEYTGNVTVTGNGTSLFVE
jgi:hypothetical protein